jgi:iron(III) transport system permease protein
MTATMERAAGNLAGPKLRSPFKDGNLGLGIVVGVVCLLTFLPMYYLVRNSFAVGIPGQPGTYFSLDAVRSVFGSTKYLASLRNSLISGAAAATLITALVGSVAWATSRTDMRGKRFLAAVSPACIAVGPIVGTMAWIALCSPRGVGLLNNLTTRLWGSDLLNVYSPIGIVFVLTFAFAPYAFLFMYGGFVALPSDHEEAARVHGARLGRIIRTISFPAVRSTLLGAWVLIFSMVIQNLSIYALVGTRSNLPTIPSDMYRLVKDSQGSTGEANLLAFMIIIPSLIVLFLHVWYTRRVGAERILGRQGGPGGIRLGRLKWLTSGLTILYAIVFAILPIAALVFASFLKYQTSDITRSLFTLDNYRMVLDSQVIRSSLVVSICLSLVAATVGTVVAFMLAYVSNRRGGWLATGAGVGPVVMLAVPGFALGLGYLSATFSNSLVRDMSGTLVGLSVAVMLAYLGYGTRVFSSGLNQYGAAYEEAAQVAGKRTWLRIFRVIAPPMVPSILAVWRFLAVLSFMEFNIVALLYTSQNVPFSVYMFGLLDSRSASSVFTLGVCQLVLLMILFLFTYLIDRRLRRY